MVDHQGAGWKVRPGSEVEPRVDPAQLDVPGSKWRGFGQAVLGFHHRVGVTAMCRCGRTVIECDVLAQARAHGLLPEPGTGRKGAPRVDRRL